MRLTPLLAALFGGLLVRVGRHVEVHRLTVKADGHLLIRILCALLVRPSFLALDVLLAKAENGVCEVRKGGGGTAREGIRPLFSPA